MYLVMFHKNWKSFLRNIAVTSLAEVWIETRCPTVEKSDPEQTGRQDGGGNPGRKDPQRRPGYCVCI